MFDPPPAKITKDFDQLPEHLQKNIKPYMRDNPQPTKYKLTGLQRSHFKYYVNKKKK